MGFLWLLLLGTETNKVNVSQNPYKPLPSFTEFECYLPTFEFY